MKNLLAKQIIFNQIDTSLTDWDFHREPKDIYNGDYRITCSNNIILPNVNFLSDTIKLYRSEGFGQIFPSVFFHPRYIKNRARVMSINKFIN